MSAGEWTQPHSFDPGDDPSMDEENRIKVLSFGGGIQSSALYVMAALGEIDRPDFAVFADTRGEKRETYEWIWYLAERFGDVLPIVIGNVGDLGEDLLRSAQENGGRCSNPPLFTLPRGMLIQKCTADYKVTAIKRAIRKRLGWSRRGRPPQIVEQWIGISTDEADRMKTSPVKWQILRYPLIERRMNRSDCVAFLSRSVGTLPPKSACVFCPYQSASRWRSLKESSPEDFERACQIDEAIRDGIDGTRERLFLHVSRSPLREAIFDGGQRDLFGDECSGICGV